MDLRSHRLPRQWTHGELVQWMSRRGLIDKAIPSDINGRAAMRLSIAQLTRFYSDTNAGKAERLYVALRAENQRIARLKVKDRMAKERVQSRE